MHLNIFIFFPFIKRISIITDVRKLTHVPHSGATTYMPTKYNIYSYNLYLYVFQFLSDQPNARGLHPVQTGYYRNERTS